MNRKQNNKLIYFLSIISIVIFWGCSVEQKHKVLTFFFDGVPPLAGALPKADTTNRNSNIVNPVVVKKDNRPKIFIHKPYLDRQCDKCHTPDRHLIMTLPSLCYQCHKDFSETYKFVHGPVSSGNCTKCHNQHSAPYAKLLIRPGTDLCLFCHQAAIVYSNKNHRRVQGANCTICHNPHGGRTRYMLKDDVAHDFNGLAAANEIASKQIFAQVYSKVPGDLKAGTEIAIQNTDQNYETIQTSFTDSLGRFAINEVRADENYTFRLKNEVNDSLNVYIKDYKDQTLFVINNNRKGKFIFEKAQYDTASQVVTMGKSLDSLRAIAINELSKRNADSISKLSANKNNSVDLITKGIDSSTLHANQVKVIAIKPRIYFIRYSDTGSIAVNEKGAEQLNKIIETLNKNHDKRAYIISRTRANASLTYNKKVADNRALAAMNYLISKGIKAKRITCIGLNRTKNENNDGLTEAELEHLGNSVVEISIIVK